MKKRYIFEVDDVLLRSDAKMEEDFFREIYGDKAYPLLSSMDEYLSRYEKIFSHYDFEDLSRFLTMKTQMYISPRVIRDWAYLLADSLDFKAEEVESVLESLKKNDKSLAVLTNWFGVSQIPRLKKAGLYDYFDDVFTGDVVMKPKKQAYLTAIGHYAPEESLVIGPSLDNDYVGAKACGVGAVLYDPEDYYHDTVVKVKKMDEILKIK